MKWSSHYIPIQAPMHERSIEIQSFENIHLVLFLDSQISLGILLIYRAPNTNDFSEKLLKLLFTVAIKIIRFIVFINLNTHAPLPLHPNWKKIPWFNSTEIFSWYFHISFLTSFGPGSALEWFIALDVNIRIPFTSAYSLVLIIHCYVSWAPRHNPLFLNIWSIHIDSPTTQTGIHGLPCHFY